MNLYSRNNKMVGQYHSADPNGYTYVDGYGFAPPPPVVTERRLLQWYSNGLGFAVLFYFLLSNVTPLLVLGLLSLFQPAIRIFGNQVVAPAAVYHLVNLISSAVCLLLPFLLFVILCRIPLRVAFPFRRFPRYICASGVCLGLGVSVIGGVASTLLSLLLSLFHLAPVMPDYSMPQQGAAMLVYAVNLVVVAPLVEETVFRGVILGALRRFGDSFALLISSVLFALIHGNLVQLPNAFLMGLLIGYFVLCTGSLWTGVIIHMVNNGMVVGFNLLSRFLPQEMQELSILFLYAGYLAVGITALLLLVRRHPNMFMFIRPTTYAPEKEKYRAFFGAATMLLALFMLVAMTVQNVVLY